MLDGRQVDSHFEAGVLCFKVEGNRGMMHGAFRFPRITNLVKIGEKVPGPGQCESVLLKYGWKVEVESIQADEALDKIKRK